MSPASSRRRILVADDDVRAALRLATLLGELGHDVQVTHDGHAAVEAARINRPQVALLELGMRGVDGFGVVQRLRRDLRLAHVRFVAMGAPDDRQRSLAAGFNEHLAKPVAAERLREMLARF